LWEQTNPRAAFMSWLHRFGKQYHDDAEVGDGPGSMRFRAGVLKQVVLTVRIGSPALTVNVHALCAGT
jgi:hypothetical protein